MHHGAKPSTFRNAAYLRRHPTKAEEMLWEKLRKNQIDGVHFRRQHPFDVYVPDFYANTVDLVIEVDGSIHDEKSVQFSDADRENNLKIFGLFLIRYTNEEVHNSIDDVVENIRLTVIELKKMKKEKRQ